MTADASAPVAQSRNASRDRIAKVAEMAIKAFAGHKVRKLLDAGEYRAWLCINPADSSYWYEVHTGPGWIMIRGDLGCMSWERTRDMIAWCRGAIRDPQYFAEKIPHEMHTTEYDKQLVEEWLEDELRDAIADRNEARQKQLIELRHELSLDDNAPDVTRQQIYDSGITDGGDFPDFNIWSHRYLWLREAMKWFLEHFEKTEFQQT